MSQSPSIRATIAAYLQRVEDTPAGPVPLPESTQVEHPPTPEAGRWDEFRAHSIQGSRNQLAAQTFVALFQELQAEIVRYLPDTRVRGRGLDHLLDAECCVLSALGLQSATGTS